MNNSGRKNHKKITEMSESEYIRFKSKRAFYYRKKQMLFSLLIISLLIIVLSMLIKGISTNAATVDKSGKCKYYKTEMIGFDRGIDKIAEDNFDPMFFDSVDDLKQEIMEINHISYDSAIPGGLIIYVPYYSDIH